MAGLIHNSLLLGSLIFNRLRSNILLHGALSRLEFYSGVTSNMNSISTGAFSGSAATPTAERT